MNMAVFWDDEPCIVAVSNIRANRSNEGGSNRL